MYTYSQRILGFVTVEQSNATHVLSELAFHTDLQDIILEQDSIAFEQELLNVINSSSSSINITKNIYKSSTTGWDVVGWRRT